MHIDRKKMEFVDKLLKKACPDYTGNKIEVETRESVTFYGTMWDGGTRHIYTIVKLDTMDIVPVPTAPYMQASKLHEHEQSLANGIAVVRYTQGHHESVDIFVHPSNMNAALLPPVTELTEDERIVLEYTRRLKSTYAGIPNYRFHEARRNTQITTERWEAAKANCIARKLLNKAGAITIDGRNAVPF